MIGQFLTGTSVNNSIGMISKLLYVIVTDLGLGFQVSYGPGPCSRKTERAKLRTWSVQQEDRASEASEVFVLHGPGS